MKKNKTLIRELRAELHYFQMQARIDARSLKSSRAKCKEIAAQMRELQSDDETNKSLMQVIRAQDPVTRIMDGDETLAAEEAQ